MSEILSKKEAENIVEMMLRPYGFTICILRYEENPEQPYGRYQLCNTRVITKTTGFWWWKKNVEETIYKPEFTGWCWEDAIEKLDKWLQTSAAPRVALAEKFREKHMAHLFNEKLKE